MYIGANTLEKIVQLDMGRVGRTSALEIDIISYHWRYIIFLDNVCNFPIISIWYMYFNRYFINTHKYIYIRGFLNIVIIFNICKIIFCKTRDVVIFPTIDFCLKCQIFTLLLRANVHSWFKINVNIKWIFFKHKYHVEAYSNTAIRETTNLYPYKQNISVLRQCLMFPSEGWWLLISEITYWIKHIYITIWIIQ